MVLIKGMGNRRKAERYYSNHRSESDAVEQKNKIATLYFLRISFEQTSMAARSTDAEQVAAH